MGLGEGLSRTQEAWYPAQICLSFKRPAFSGTESSHLFNGEPKGT